MVIHYDVVIPYELTCITSSDLRTLFFFLKKIKFLFLKMAVINLDVNNAMLTVLIDDPPSQSSLIRLNLTENLSNIRKELETDDIINDTLSFSRKIPLNNSYNLAEILREREENFLLK